VFQQAAATLHGISLITNNFSNRFKYLKIKKKKIRFNTNEGTNGLIKNINLSYPLILSNQIINYACKNEYLKLHQLITVYGKETELA